jgi:hypothetical protein
MYLFIIILGCFNGLMLMPILLKYFGPDTDPIEVKRAKVKQQIEVNSALKMKDN